MTTVINNPSPSTPDNNSSLAPLLTLLTLGLLGFLFFVYGLPLLRRASAPPQINVPDKVDIDIKTPNNPPSTP
jgi:hypothetical protein